MGFSTVMQKPFVKKARRIERNLKLLEREQRSQKSVEDVRKIHEMFSRVTDHCIGKIAKATGHSFTHTNFFLFVFLYKEINAVFNEAKTNPISAGKEELLRPGDLDEMLSVATDRLTLAYIGDAALELGVMTSIWNPKTLDIPSNEFLHKQRTKLVENAPLAKLWDSLELYDPVILIRPSHENDATKGSYMEAVFGIIYLEGGLVAVEKALKKLRKACMKSKKFPRYPGKVPAGRR